MSKTRDPYKRIKHLLRENGKSRAEIYAKQDCANETAETLTTTEQAELVASEREQPASTEQQSQDVTKTFRRNGKY